MLKTAIGTLAGTIFVGVGVVTWLVWPAPSVELNWEAMAEELILEEDCFGAARLMGTYSINDPIGFDNVRDDFFQQSSCAIPEDSDFAGAQLFLNGILPSDSRDLSLMEPTPWWEGIKEATQRWDDIRWARRHVGMGFAGWTDAIAFFRCERALGNFPAGHWLSARDELHSLFPDYVAPYDARRARCIALVEAEFEQVSNFDVGPDHRDGEAFQKILNDYEFLLHVLRGSMEFIEN